MSREQQQEQANTAAEEILRLVYGDDLQGCAVSLDAIAAVVRKSIEQTAGQNAELLDLHEKVVEAVDILSTPPVQHTSDEPGSLLNLLGNRLDAIHTITQKLHATTALIKGQADSGAE